MATIFTWNDRFMRQAGAVLGALSMVALLWGCSFSSAVEKTSRTLQQTSRKITFRGNDYKRLVAFGTGENASDLQEDEFHAMLAAGIPDHLFGDCGDALIPAADAPGPSSFLKEPPRLASGNVDAYALAIIGRQLGINAVVFSSLENIGVIEELNGIIFKDKDHYVEMVVRTQIYQPLTATKIMDAIYRRKVSVEEEEYALYRQPGQPPQMQLPALKEAFGEMIEEIGEDICAALAETPWSGFVTAVDRDKVILSAGSLAGLETGAELAVYDSSQTIEGADGQRFFLLGERVAQIKIVSLTDQEAEALQIDGDPIKVGSSVRRGQ